MELCELLAAASAAGSVSDMSPSLEKLEALVASGEVRDAEPWPARLCETLAGLLRAVWADARAPKAAAGGAARRVCAVLCGVLDVPELDAAEMEAALSEQFAHDVLLRLRVRSPDDERPALGRVLHAMYLSLIHI